MNLSPESDSDAIDGLRNDLLAIIEKRGTPREYAPRTTRQLNALISLITERDALKEMLAVAEPALFELRGTYECRGDYYDGWASSALRKIDDLRRAHAACHNTQPDQGGKAE